MADPSTLRTALEALHPRGEGAQYAAGDAVTSTHLCLGWADRARHVGVVPATTFHAFSATKPVTAVAILQLVERGLLSLSDALVDHLPELPYRNGATVRDALSHQAGLPSPLPFSWVHPDADHATFDGDAFYRSVIQQHRRAGLPGRRARYTNLGFLLLGRIIEARSGLPYEAYVKQHVLDVVLPADRGEAWLGFDLPHGRHAVGYLRRWSALGLFTSLMPDPHHLQAPEGGWIAYRPFHVNGPAYGGLKGNTLGWSYLLRALAARDERLLAPASYEALFTPQPLRSGACSGHALSFMTGTLMLPRGRAEPYVCHPGGGPGYCSEIRIYPDCGRWSVLLANTTIVHDARRLDAIDPVVFAGG